MKRLKSRTRRLLDRYMHRVGAALAGCPGTDRDEIERDIREHVEMALEGAPEPVPPRTMASVLERLGSPAQWLGHRAHCAESAAAPSTDDWRLAYLSLGLFLLALALPPFLWVGLLGAFVAARASLAAAERAGTTSASGQTWLRLPALLVVTVPLLGALLLWPAIAVRLLADRIVGDAWLAQALPAGIGAVAERIASIRLTSFDLTDQAGHLLRSAHWLLAPLGVWWLVLGLVARALPGPFAWTLRPLTDDRAERLGRWLLAGGTLLGLASLLQAAVKLACGHVSLV
jgi:hypothetical protein